MSSEQVVIRLDQHDKNKVLNIVATCEAQIKLRKQRESFVHPNSAGTTKVGYTAELAFAKWLGVPFSYRPYDRLSTDVMGYQIKATLLTAGCLIKKITNPAGVYVLGTVNDTYDVVIFRGWMLSSEIEHECYWRTDVPNPAWFVPQSQLWSMSELTATKELAAHNGAF